MKKSVSLALVLLLALSVLSTGVIASNDEQNSTIDPNECKQLSKEAIKSKLNVDIDNIDIQGVKGLFSKNLLEKKDGSKARFKNCICIYKDKFKKIREKIRAIRKGEIKLSEEDKAALKECLKKIKEIKENTKIDRAKIIEEMKNIRETMENENFTKCKEILENIVSKYNINTEKLAEINELLDQIIEILDKY